MELVESDCKGLSGVVFVGFMVSKGAATQAQDVKFGEASLLVTLCKKNPTHRTLPLLRD